MKTRWWKLSRDETWTLTVIALVFVLVFTEQWWLP